MFHVHCHKLATRYTYVGHFRISVLNTLNGTKQSGVNLLPRFVDTAKITSTLQIDCVRTQGGYFKHLLQPPERRNSQTMLRRTLDSPPEAWPWSFRWRCIAQNADSTMTQCYQEFGICLEDDSRSLLQDIVPRSRWISGNPTYAPRRAFQYVNNLTVTPSDMSLSEQWLSRWTMQSSGMWYRTIQ